MTVITQNDAPAVESAKPQYYTVRDSLTTNRIFFRSVSETRARTWVENHCPRGSDMFLQYPDGTMYAYEQERGGPRGTDVELWQPFNPEEYSRPEESSMIAPDEWADAEA